MNRCPYCIVGVGEPIKAGNWQWRSIADDRALVGKMTVLDGFRCNVCGASWLTDTTPDPKPEEMICDFCSTPRPPHTFHTRVFRLEARPGIPGHQMELPEQVMDENWAACDECAAFIKAEDRDGLFGHVMTRTRERIKRGTYPPVPEALLAPELRLLQNGFWENRMREKDE